MPSTPFAHLHVHSEFSLLDGANRIADLVEACRRDGQTALALTDHGNLFGAIDFYQQCVAAGIKPILGCEVYVARSSRREPHNKVHNPYNHLTLLARDEQGWRNLLRLASISYLEGLHFRPRIDKEVLARHARGLTCLSGCLSGEICQSFARERPDQAERTAAEYADLFGREHFWLELQRNGIDVQARVNESLVDLARRTGIPLVATNDIHYLRHEDCAAQDVLLCINTGAKRSDTKRFKMDTDSLFFRTGAEMARVFHDLPRALCNTLDVAEQVDLRLAFGTYHLPVFVPEGDETPEQLFDRLCEEGLARRYGAQHAAARARLETEKRVIREMGFVSYFLIVWDLIRWARQNGIPVGPGRGSAAGSIVAYLLDVTRVDPLRYDLLFERFLNSARSSMPDIDIDFCKEGRERVLDYTRRRYGAENVAQIGTFATLSARSVVRDVGRVLDIPLGEVDRLAKMIPQGPSAPPLEESLVADADLKQARKDPRYTDLFAYSVALDGLARHISTHAAGVVIADRPIVEHVPLCVHGTDVVTQFPAKQLEDLGLLKMDYLGLRTLTILDKTLALLRARGQAVPDLDALPLDDGPTYALLNRGETLGVFQLESDGMRKLLARIRPDCFEDLIAVLALYRPGPLESGMADMFARRKHGLERIVTPHPSLESILRDTYGCIVYQEQVMLISNVLGGFSLNEADNLRKAMGKKKPEILARYAAKFVAGAVERGALESGAREIWDGIEKFGGYGFNKSHSTAYALITWQTAYLKAHHRVEFLAANFSCEMSSTDKIKDFVDDARRALIPILPPDVTRSAWEFLPEGDSVRFGLGAIKGTGQKAIEALVRSREELNQRGERIGLETLCMTVDPQLATKATWEALVKAGAFDATDGDRATLLAALDHLLAEGARAAADRKAGQGTLFGASATAGAPLSPRAPLPASPAVARASRSELLRAEHDVLGFYLSGHPLEERAGLFRILSTGSTRQLAGLAGQSEVVLGGLVVGLRESTTKAGKKMARFRLEDLEGGVNVTCFPRTWEECRTQLADDTVVLVRARTEEREGSEGSTEVQLLLEEVLPLDRALERFQGALVIALAAGIDEACLDELLALLARHRGKHRLFLEVTGADGRTRRVRAGERHGVRLSAELAQEIERLLGAGRARLARA
jgi:DNA polymerase-3 subunit alpha